MSKMLLFCCVGFELDFVVEIQEKVGLVGVVGFVCVKLDFGFVIFEMVEGQVDDIL